MTVRCTSSALALFLIAVACTGSGAGDATNPAPSASSSPGRLAETVAIETAPPPRDGWLDAACALPPEQVLRVARGYAPGRSPDLMIVPRAPNFFGSFTASTHSGPWDYLQRVPIVFYGPGFIRARGEIDLAREPTSADIAPTLAELLKVEWPSNRGSSALSQALLPEHRRAGRPRLIVTVVWDGGGRDVLDQWRGEWPNLEEMIENGTSFGNAVVGSSPSVTPAVHASIGTGVFPEQHGIVDIRQRADGEVVGSWSGNSPEYLLTPSLADLYDQEVDNTAEVAALGDHVWHLGMIGHGSYLDGADRDIGIITRLNGAKVTNPNYYRLPEYLEDVEGFEEDVLTIDTSDGEADSRWLDNDILDEPRLARESPAATLYQTRLIKDLLTNESFGQDEVPDLFFTNYKQIDYVGHRYNMVEPEMREAVRYTDQELGDLIEFLDKWVGENQWMMALTADHGSTPRAEATKAWPINTTEVLTDLEEHFGVPQSELIQAPRVTGFWLEHDGLEANGITSEEIADFLLDMRVEDNAVDLDDLPAGYEQQLDEHIFSAVWPSERMDEVLECAGLGP